MGATETLSALYKALELAVPERIVCCESPRAGLQVVRELERPLFGGTDPELFIRLMRTHRRMVKRYSNPFPSPLWKETKDGSRLLSRAQLVKEALLEGCPGFEDLCRDFRFDAQKWCGDEFELRKPMCMSSDAVGETLYEVSKLARGKVPPEWGRLKDFCASAGWVWPFERVAVICANPKRSIYDSKLNLLHCQDGPAVTFQDNWAVWAWQGKQVPRHVIETPGAVSEEELLKVKDLQRLRMMLERRSQPLSHPRLQKLKRMVDGKQFCRFDRRHLPSKAKPWPARMMMPKPPNRPHQVPPDGIYYKLYGDGQLELVAWSEKGQMIYLFLEHGRAAGYFHVHLGGEQYYEDGRMEDFTPWDDSSPAYYVEKSFEEWVCESLGRFPRG
ncbi:hypothetical protein JST97_31260 [bacterium]|nr:hypothetical protein [bacterium]